MKNLKTIMIALALIVSANVFAGNEKAVVKTSAQCEMCKANISKTLNGIEGVQKFVLNTETQELIVKFDDEATSLDAIETAIANTGYWANDKTPNKEAYAALDDCCKPKAKACCAAGSKTCSKDAAKSKVPASDAKKACCAAHEGAKKECAHGDAKSTTEPAKKSSCTGHTH